MYYIEKVDKPSFINKMTGKVQLKDDKILVYVGEKIPSLRKTKSIAKKTHKILDKTNSRKIVLSKDLQKNEIYKNLLYSYGYDIADGKWLFEAISYMVLDYIVKNKQIVKEEVQISVLVNNLTQYSLENIKAFSKEYKKLNIVTNHIEKFKKIQDDIFVESGLMITVTNNKKRSLAKSNIILNIDFPSELVNRFYIYDEAIFLDLTGNVTIQSKRFNGFLVNDYEICVKPETFLTDSADLYFTKELYEASILHNIPFTDLKKSVFTDGVKIAKLYGKNNCF